MKTRARVYAAASLSTLFWILDGRLPGRTVAKLALCAAYFVAVELLARKRRRKSICTCPEIDHNTGCPAAESAEPSPTPEQGV